MYKSHTCGELRITHVDQTVRLAGWVHRRRDHGGVTFIDLRDRFGIVQLVANPEISPNAHQALDPVRGEWVIQVEGLVCKRPQGMINPSISTGEVEIEVNEVTVLSTARTPPIYIIKEEDADEQTRLRYRYLDLRRNRMRSNLELRHRVVKYIRDYLDDLEFWEIETPILFKTTPEGARDYLVPSRIHPGDFYALPQSPQQLKQLLMVGGIERYFQIARCFRDEDQRGDRQPEFTQLDLEMSFVEREDIMELTENLFTRMVAEVVPDKTILSSPWPRFTYREVLNRFGKDNPDIRFDLELKDITDLLEMSGYRIFDRVIAEGGHVRGINVKGQSGYSRKMIDELSEFVQQFGAKGLAYLALDSDDKFRSSFAKYIKDETTNGIIKRLDAAPGDLLLFIADQPEIVYESLGRLRELLGSRFGMIDTDILAFCWVIDFPFVVWNEEEARWDPSHHLFTAPMVEDIHLLETDPGKARGQQYDMVLNGYEVGGGSIRIHDSDLQAKVFELIGLDRQVATQRFGHLLEAFQYGTPPHGGIAPGIDRICMVLAGEPNIREVIAFPKNQNARDVMADAPSPVEPEQLEELHIKLNV